MNHQLFKFNTPENFEIEIDQCTRLRFSNNVESYDIQSAQISIYLFEIKAIANMPGDDFLAQYSYWSEGFKTTQQHSEITQHQGYSTYKIYNETDALFQGQHFKIKYVNACILLDEQWCVDFQFTYETQHHEQYKNLAESTLASVEVLGNSEDWLRAHQADMCKTQADYQADLAAKEPESPLTKTPAFAIPKNAQESIQIDEFDFSFIQSDCIAHTVEFNQRFCLQIKAKTTQIQPAKAKNLLCYAYNLEEGEIMLSLNFVEIYQQGIANGEFIYEENRTDAPHFLNLRLDGIDLDFYGTVTLQSGWVGINGFLKKSYKDQPCFPISIYKKIALDSIDWSLYQFSLKELLPEASQNTLLQNTLKAKQILPHQVRHLRIEDFQQPRLPKEVLAFKNLATLIIHGRTNDAGSVSALQEIGVDLSEFSLLNELSICNTSVRALPESIGELSHLQRLNVSNNQLMCLPDKLFTLPKLSALNATNNQLTSVPEMINLPALKTLDLAKNQLITLPESLTNQAQLQQLTLTNNPWKYLPSTFNNLIDCGVNIEMNIEDKHRLLDYSYKGADGKGMVTWDNDVYLAKFDPALKQILLSAIDDTVLKKYQRPLLDLALKAICLTTTEPDDYHIIGNTRFGGLPDLPEQAHYPTWYFPENNTNTNAENSHDEKSDHEEQGKNYHSVFIAQLNCQELAPYQDYLPRQGLLYFYIDDEEDFNCRVIYCADTRYLQSAQNLTNHPWQFFDMEEPYEAFKAQINRFVALPSFYHDDYWYDCVNAIELKNLEDYNHPDHQALSESVQDNVSKALGEKGAYQQSNSDYYPDKQHSINDYVFTQHESPQQQAALKYKGKPEDWLVLLKVNSDNNCGFCFWDAGELFFVIHKSDLAKGDFSRVYASIESS